MRMAYVCMDRGISVFGWTGSSVHVQEVIRAMSRLGVQVELFTARLDGEPPPDLALVPVHCLPVLQEGPCATREQSGLAKNRDLRVALQRAGPFDLVYERYSLWSFAGMEFARDMGASGLLEVNAPLIEQQVRYRRLVDRAGAEQVAQRAFAAATALIALSDEIGAYLERYPNTRRRTHVIPDGVDPDRFPAGFKPSFPGSPGEFTVGFVGSLKPWHGMPSLVEAFTLFHQRCPNSRLLIVGDGPERTNLVSDVRMRGLAKAVQFTGAVPPADVPGLLASMDVAVAPYPMLPDFYFSPLKVFEYMAAGLPVVASRIGQLATLIEDGVNGLLCTPGDALHFVAALERLLSNPKLRRQLGREARATVLRDYTWEVVGRRILAVVGFQAGPTRRSGLRSADLPYGKLSPRPARAS